MIIDHNLNCDQSTHLNWCFIQKLYQIYCYCYIAFCALNPSTNCVSHNLTLHISAFNHTLCFCTLYDPYKNMAFLNNVYNGNAVCFLYNVNISLKSYVQDFCALSWRMRSNLIVKTFHLNTLKQDVQPDTEGLLFKIQCLLYRIKLHLNYKDQPVNDV